MFDQALDERLNLFASMEGINPGLIPFVTEFLESLDIPHEQRTDAVLGMLASHLIGLLQRTYRQDGIASFDASDIIDEVIQENPQALTMAQQLAEQAYRQLGVRLPEMETRILALHFTFF